jgi:hypothetical protein
VEQRSAGGSVLRKLLYTMIVVSGLASMVGAGTYASFNAATQNASSTFSTGSLVLDRNVAATTCWSFGVAASTDDNANSSCAAVVDLDRVKIGDSNTVDIILKNGGSLPGTLSFGAVAACTSSANPGVNWTLGTGDMCTNTAFVLQEWSAGFSSAMSTCAYPASGVSGCSFTTPATLTANATPPSPAVGATPGLPLASSPQTLGAIAAGASRYFRMTFVLPTGVSNELQGRRAQFQLTWSLV